SRKVRARAALVYAAAATATRRAPPPKLDPNLTTRQRFAQHATDPACSGCHMLMDPIGLGMESFDGVGLYRTTDGNQTIDASGQINSADVAGPFVGVVDLAKKLSQSQDVRACLTKQWFRFGYGRGETDEDTGTLTALGTSGDNLQKLLVALTQT